MLDFIYYPVSLLLRVWYKLFSSIFGPTNSFSWILAIVFLVLTLRLALFSPFKKQVKSAQVMQAHAAEMKEIRKKYANDKQAQMQAQRELSQKIGAAPFAGCITQLAQAVVFYGLFHVLRSFNHVGGGSFLGSNKGLSPEEARHTKNYFFTPDEVTHFLDSRVFGVPLSSYITQDTHQFLAFMKHPTDAIDFTRWQITVVLLPLMIISALATHFNARNSIAHQQTQDVPQQAKFMQILMLWIFPLGSFASGLFMPGSLLVYFMTNNICTFLQTRIVYSDIQKKQEIERQELKEKQENLAPKPGAKPKKIQKAREIPSGKTNTPTQTQEFKSRTRTQQKKKSPKNSKR